MTNRGIREDLRRELGFWDALTIGAGTMIGAGIFLLAGVALEETGPAAVLSYLGPAMGAISGVGIWLSLTVAIAFYLFGMGEYFSRFIPVTPFWGALGGGLLLTALNVVGARESGRTQLVVVLVLLLILGGFSM